MFQDHQAESLAGAMSLTLANAQAKRRSSDQLLCEARKALLLGGSGGGCGGGLGVGFVGLVEHSEASLCLLLHTFRVDALFDSCCRPPSPSSKERGKCALFSLHTTTNSADDRAQGPGQSDSSSKGSSSSEGSSSGAGDSGGGSSSYLEAYFSDTSVLAALYEVGSQTIYLMHTYVYGKAVDKHRCCFLLLSAPILPPTNKRPPT